MSERAMLVQVARDRLMRERGMCTNPAVAAKVAELIYEVWEGEAGLLMRLQRFVERVPDASVSLDYHQGAWEVQVLGSAQSIDGPYLGIVGCGEGDSPYAAIQGALRDAEV
jgi:hypothetical protein